jgi:hypothetical protein
MSLMNVLEWSKEKPSVIAGVDFYRLARLMDEGRRKELAAFMNGMEAKASDEKERQIYAVAASALRSPNGSARMPNTPKEASALGRKELEELGPSLWMQAGPKVLDAINPRSLKALDPKTLESFKAALRARTDIPPRKKHMMTNRLRTIGFMVVESSLPDIVGEDGTNYISVSKVYSRMLYSALPNYKVICFYEREIGPSVAISNPSDPGGHKTLWFRKDRVLRFLENAYVDVRGCSKKLSAMPSFISRDELMIILGSTRIRETTRASFPHYKLGGDGGSSSSRKVVYDIDDVIESLKSRNKLFSKLGIYSICRLTGASVESIAMKRYETVVESRDIR